MKIKLTILSIILATTLSGQKIYIGDHGREDTIFVMENSYCEITDTIAPGDFSFFAVKKDDQHIYLGKQVDLELNGSFGPWELTISHHDENGVFIEDIGSVVPGPQIHNMSFIDNQTLLITAGFDYVLFDINTRTSTQHSLLDELFEIRDAIVFDSTIFVSQFLTTNDLSIFDIELESVSPIPEWGPLGIDFFRSHSQSFDIIGGCKEDIVFISSHKSFDRTEAFLTYQRPPNFEIENECYLDFLESNLAVFIDVIQYPLMLDFDSTEEYCDNNDTTITIQLCADDNISDVAIDSGNFNPYLEDHQDHIDSMTIEIIGGPNRVRLEDDNPQLLTQRYSDHKITLFNDGGSSIKDFRQAILSAEISGLASPFNGTIEVQFQVFSYIRRSLPASLFIDISTETIEAGRDTSITLCPLDVPQDLNDYLSGGAQIGQWLQGPIYNPQQDTPGQYNYVVTSTTCPDDTARITVQLHPEAIIDRQLYNLCPGDSILYAGRYYTEETMLSDTINAVESGCDSVYTEVEISILSQATVVQIDTSLCYGDQLEIDNQMYDSEGSYIHTVSSQQSGCDSIAYEINLEIIPEASRIIIDTILCTGESIIIGSLTIDRDTVSEIIIKDLSQCDSIIYDLDVQIAEVQYVVIDTILCNGQSIEIEGILYESASQDLIIIYDQQGCDSIIYDLNILIEETVMIMDQQYEIEANVPTVVSIEVPSNNENIFWQTSIGLSCDDCLSPEVTLDIDQEYVVTLTSEEGCSQEIIVNVLVTQSAPEASDYYIANIIDISSNDNDVLYVQSSESMMTYSMTIFDRWGSVVYDQKDILVNDKSEGWNGMYNNQAELSQGIYVYKIEMEDGEVLVGDVMLVR